MTLTFGTVTGTFTTARSDGADSARPVARVRIDFDPIPGIIRDSETDVIILGNTVSVVTDTNGQFTVELVATDDPDLSPAYWAYGVTITPPGPTPYVTEFSILVPGGSSQNLADIMPVPPSPGVIIPPDGVTKEYVDAGDARTLQSAKVYTDTAVGAIVIPPAPDVTKAYVDQQDAATLGSAKTYTDTAVGGIVIPPAPDVTKAYVDQQDAATLGSANAHADAGDATTLGNAKTYTDTAVAGVGGGLASAMTPGSWSQPTVTGGFSSLNLTADDLVLFPFIPARDGTATQLGIFLNTGVAGGTMVMALYGPDATGRPAALLAQTAAIDTAAFGWKAGALGAGVALRAGGRYWLGIVGHGSSAINVRSLTYTSSPALVTPPDTGANAYGYKTAGVVGALPNPFTTYTTFTTAYAVAIRVLIA